MNEIISEALVPFLSGSGGTALMYYIFKKKLDYIDEIPGIKKDVEGTNKAVSRIEAELDKIEKFREEQILLKAEVKAAWRHIDDLKNTVGA